MEQTVNERVRLLIKSLGISQLEASKQLQVTPSTFGKWYSDGAIRKSNLKVICSTWNVSYEWLSDGRGDMFLEGGIKLEKKTNGWKDEAYNKMEQYNESLRQEVAFLKGIVNSLLPAQKQQKSFNYGAGSAGFLFEKLPSSVRA